MTQFQKPLVQANGCIQYPVATQCAICFSHLRVQSLALATIFAIALLPVLLLLFARNEVCPLVAACVAKGFCSQPKFCHWICRPCFYPRHVFATVFATDVAVTFAPVGFFHPCCPADCHRHCHCFCPRGCHACCHQIWAPNRALFLNFR